MSENKEAFLIDGKPVRVFVGTPMYGGMCTGTFMTSFINFLTLASANGVQVGYKFLYNESLITRARNTVVNSFEKSEFTHLMFIDADIAFNPEDILTMVKADKDIICGIYPKKEINWANVGKAYEAGVRGSALSRYSGAFVINAKEGTREFKLNEPLEIQNAGTGFMLIKRSVFEKLADVVPSYSNDVHDLSGQLKTGEKIREYFTTSIEPESNRLLSEDYHFCRLARMNGMSVWAAPWVRLGHTGTHTFSGVLG